MSSKKIWYAVLYLEIEEDFDEDLNEASYYDLSKVIALSDTLPEMTALAKDLNAQHGIKIDAKTANEMMNRYEDYANKGAYVTDELRLTDEEVEKYAKQGKIIGRPGFKLVP